MEAPEDLVITTRRRAISHFVIFYPDGTLNNFTRLVICVSVNVWGRGPLLSLLTESFFPLILSFSHCLFSLSLFGLLSPPLLPLTLSRFCPVSLSDSFLMMMFYELETRRIISVFNTHILTE